MNLLIPLISVALAAPVATTQLPPDRPTCAQLRAIVIDAVEVVPDPNDAPEGLRDALRDVIDAPCEQLGAAIQSLMQQAYPFFESHAYR